MCLVIKCLLFSIQVFSVNTCIRSHMSFNLSVQVAGKFVIECDVVL